MKKLFAIALPSILIVVLAGLTAGCGGSTGGKPSSSAPATTGSGDPNFASSSNWLAVADNDHQEGRRLLR